MKNFYSIGCDCHPAMVLKVMGLRKKSSPFDWLDTNSLNTFEYFYDMIQTEFKNFMREIVINNEKPFSKYYPYSLFHHDPNIKDDIIIQQKYLRRISRFLDHYKHSSCVFLANIKSDSITSYEIVNKLYLDCVKIINDSTFIKNNHILFIYIRYDDDFIENNEYINELYSKIKNLDKNNIFLIQYNRNLQEGRLSGDPNMYSTYFNLLLHF